MEPSNSEYPQKKLFIGIVLMVIVVLMVGLLVAKQQKTPAQDMERQIALLSNLHRGDLIVFTDSRIWCVRNDTAGSDLQVVQWNGDTSHTMSKTSFVMGAPKFWVVRKGNASYNRQLERFVQQ